VLYACEATLDAILVIAAIQVAASALWWVHSSYAHALMIGAGIVQLALDLRWATLRVERRGCCLELLMAGRRRLPLTALTRERERLADPRLQSRLADSFDDLAALAALNHWRRERQRPMYSQRVLAAVEPHLRDVAERLRAGDVEVRGVALLEHLVTDGASPLYGAEIGSFETSSRAAAICCHSDHQTAAFHAKPGLGSREVSALSNGGAVSLAAAGGPPGLDAIGEVIRGHGLTPAQPVAT